MIDFNIVTALIVAAVLIVLIRFVLPYLKAKGMQDDIYSDIKLGLLMFGYAFRDEKIKDITNKVFNVVSVIEQLDIAPVQKKTEALEIAFIKLMDELNVVLDPDALSVIINIAVSYLPKTNVVE